MSGTAERNNLRKGVPTEWPLGPRVGQLRGTTLDVDCYGEYRATRPHRSSRRPWLCGAGASIVASCRLGSGLVGWRSERGRERTRQMNFTQRSGR